MHVRPFAAKDVPAAVALSRACWYDPARQLGSPVWRTEQDFYEQMSVGECAPHEHYLVAEAPGGQLAGLAGIEPADGGAVLHGPIVAPPFAGQGLGRRLLAGALDLAREAGSRRAVASLGRGNTAGRRLLRAAGFGAAEPGTGCTLMEIQPGQLRAPQPDPAVRVELAARDEVPLLQEIDLASQPAGRLARAEIYRWCVDPQMRVFTLRHASRLAGFLRLDLRLPAVRHLRVVPALRDGDPPAHLCSQALVEGWRLVGDRPITLAVPGDDDWPTPLFRRLGSRHEVALDCYIRAL